MFKAYATATSMGGTGVLSEKIGERCELSSVYPCCLELDLFIPASCFLPFPPPMRLISALVSHDVCQSTWCYGESDCCSDSLLVGFPLRKLPIFSMTEPSLYKRNKLSPQRSSFLDICLLEIPSNVGIKRGIDASF